VFRVKRSLITTDNNNYPTFSEQATLTNEYGSMNGQVVKTASTFIKNPGPNESIELTNYNLYDEKANLLEYTKKGQKSSFL
jgi:hypothetical protein